MGVEVFISHHTATSLHIVEGIANNLESKGIPCWYAPRDTEGDYATSIMKAIAQCSVFVLILNHPASESAHVLNELNAITERIANKENVSIIPFHVADDEISAQAKYYIGRMNWIDAMTPPMYQRVDELANKIVTVLEKNRTIPARKNPEDVQTEETQYKVVSRLPETRDNFMGREELIEEIDNYFNSGEHILFLEGIGGIGKSELAKQYYMKNREKYDNVLFLTYQSDLCDLICDDISLNIQGISRRQDEKDEEYFNRKIKVLQSVCDEKTLLIIDNFDVDTDEKMNAVLGGRYHVLFTTRNAHPGHKCLKVECIRDKTILRNIFESHYGECLEEDEIPVFYKILEMIEYHTYALELIAKQMAASFLDIDEMYDILSKGKLKEIDTETVDGRTDSKSSFEHICKLFNVFGLSDQEKDVLRKLSLVGIEGIPAKRFKKWAELDSFETVNSLIKRSWVRRGRAQRLSLHPLVNEVVHAELEPGIDTCHAFLFNMTKYCAKAWYHPYDENMEILSCVQTVMQYAEPFKGTDADILEPYIVFLWIQGKYDDAIDYGHKLYEACVRDLGEINPKTAYCAKSLAGCYYNCRRAEESVVWYLKALDIMLECGKEYTLDLAMCYEKAGLCYSWIWNRDFEKAEYMFARCLELREKALEDAKEGREIPWVLAHNQTDYEDALILYGQTFLEMGRMYQLKEDYEKAVICSVKYREAILKLKVYNEENIAFADNDHGVCLVQIARQKLKEGREEEAFEDLKSGLKYLESALEINMRRHGDTSMDTIDTQEAVADAYALLKQYNQASNAYMAVIAMVEKALGKENPRIDKVKRKMDFTKEFPEEEKPLFL